MKIRGLFLAIAFVASLFVTAADDFSEANASSGVIADFERAAMGIAYFGLEPDGVTERLAFIAAYEGPSASRVVITRCLSLGVPHTGVAVGLSCTEVSAPLFAGELKVWRQENVSNARLVKDVEGLGAVDVQWRGTGTMPLGVDCIHEGAHSASWLVANPARLVHIHSSTLGSWKSSNSVCGGVGENGQLAYSSYSSY